MKLVMIHGIGQEDRDEAGLLAYWKGLLNDHAPGLLNNFQPEMAYYGSELAKWTRGDPQSGIAMGTGGDGFDPQDNDEMKFLARALGEAAQAEGLTEESIEAAASEADAAAEAAVPMSTFLGRRIVGIVRALEAISPAKGALLLRIVRQAYTYLAKPGAATAVDKLVRPRLNGEKVVILSHSLGTVIAFKLLREMEQQGNGTSVPLLLTLGSPLALEAVKSRLGPPRRKPGAVKKWINFYDPGDPVTLGKPLSKQTFAADIDNFGDVDNDTPNAHSIDGYLPDSRIHKALLAAL